MINAIKKPSKLAASKKREYTAAALMAGPQVFGTLIFSLIPIAWSVYLSFTSGYDYTRLSFAGLSNYVKVFQSANLRYEIFNTFYYAIAVVVLSVSLGLLLANVLNQPIRGRNLFRVIYYLPCVTMAAASGMVWRTMFNSTYGIINRLLKFVGISGPKWLTDPNYMMLAVIIVGVWQSLGHNMIILLAGLNNLPTSYYEAADIDGASKRDKFLHITVPLLSPVIFFVCITSTMSAFKAFDIIYTLSNAESAVDRYMRYYRTLVYGIYEKGFIYSKLGEASAEAVFLLLIILVLTLIQFKGQKKWVHYD